MAFDISEAQVVLTEAELGLRLPPVYRSMMMACNGGTAWLKESNDEDDTWQLYPIKDASDRKRLSRSCNHILAETKSAKEWGGFPDDALAIAADGGGDLLVILPDASDASAYGDGIFIFFHELGELKPFADDLSRFTIE
ncbi:SMI1/KNR4 family protein [Haloferula sp. BvORR071]|uniref:SMI1/KNR4 family protein n=1 Tax=Haloferula sp. BvORR071 TaxID=1396141 RepID=UPI00055409E4|nr:SMI1/KNR4 family protein [Haloferula sp. BvORR071]